MPVFPSMVSGPSTLPTAEHHPLFYFEDGSVIILVEKTLYKIFRSTLIRHSKIFSDVFSLPPSKDPKSLTHGEGCSDNHPFELHGISNVDFERLLWVLYPPIYGQYQHSTAEEWISVLELATRWDFSDIRALAIRKLEDYPVGSVQRIILSQRYDISSPWATQGYLDLCQRRHPLSLEEASMLGIDLIVRIAQVRERLRTSAGVHSKSPAVPRVPYGRIQLSTSKGIPAPKFGMMRISSRSEGPPDLFSKHRGRGAVVESATDRASRLISEAFGLSG